MSIWLQLALCVALIGVAGTRLTRYGDAIADKTGLGGTWIGVILIASVTSLPELATGISAVTVAGVPDIAVGDLLGSCVFNLLILAALDVLNRRASMYVEASQGHILSSGFGVILIGIVGMSIVLSQVRPAPAIGHVGVYSLVLVVLYLVAMRTVFRYEKRHVGEFADREEDAFPGLSLRQAGLRYALAACVVILAGVWLPFVGHALAGQMGWYHSFVGTLFVAFVTSLPEIVVTLAAVRLNALDMAVGGILGSNLFNMAIIAVDDLFFTRGPILAEVAPSHAVSAFSAIMMTGLVLVALMYRLHRIRHVIGWASLGLLAVFLVNAQVQYRFGG
jgi:cation:H+ antiporter